MSAWLISPPVVRVAVARQCGQRDWRSRWRPDRRSAVRDCCLGGGFCMMGRADSAEPPNSLPISSRKIHRRHGSDLTRSGPDRAPPNRALLGRFPQPRRSVRGRHGEVGGDSGSSPSRVTCSLSASSTALGTAPAPPWQTSGCTQHSGPRRPDSRPLAGDGRGAVNSTLGSHLASYHDVALLGPRRRRRVDLAEAAWPHRSRSRRVC